MRIPARAYGYALAAAALSIACCVVYLLERSS